MRRGALTNLIAIALVGSSAVAFTRFDQSNYLPGVLHHLEQARVSAEAGHSSLALAHSEVILHERGLGVYIDLAETPPDIREACLSAARRALQYWNFTIGEGALVEVDTPDLAKIRIQFAREVTLRGSQVGGYCSQSRGVTLSGDGEEATPEYSATILARFQLPRGPALNEDCLQNIVAHELGHVYGLRDCVEPDHLMSPLNPSRPKLDLHPDELEALHQLRLMVFGIQRSVQSKVKDN